jgi:outer membrane protein assembly factor BamD (BamD/ComL family)
MNRCILLYILFIFTFYIQAESSQKYLFINSTPIRAKVLIDGVDKGILTPCIIKDLNGVKIIKLVKQGYKDQIIEFSNIKSKKIDIYLTSATFDLYFPENNIYKIGDIVKKGPFYLSNIDEGSYEFKIDNNKINFIKLSPFQTSEIILGTSLGIVASYMFTSIGLTEYFKYKSESTTIDFDSRHYDLLSRGFDISKYISISVTSVLSIALMSILITDFSIRYKEKQAKYEIMDKAPIEYSKTLYDNALDFLSKGEIEKSVTVLQSLISLYPTNDYVPMAYYQLGQNYFILKQYDKALENWDIFIKDYPVFDYYDYVLKNISEIYFMRKDYKTALIFINKAVFTENILDRETIFAYKAKINFEIYNSEKNENYYNLTENQYLLLLDSFPNSDRITTYYQQLIRLYNMSGNTDKLIDLKKKAESISDPSIKDLVLSLFK